MKMLLLVETEKERIWARWNREGSVWIWSEGAAGKTWPFGNGEETPSIKRRGLDSQIYST
jgi:hypothetical protein